MFKDEIKEIKNKYRTFFPGRELAEVIRVFDFAISCAEERPQQKVVDLSVLTASGIDCEFWSDPGDDKNPQERGPLKRIASYPDGAVGFIDANNFKWPYCRPRHDHLHAWPGGECPLPEGLLIKVATLSTVLEGGFRLLGPNPSTHFRRECWTHRGTVESPIIAFEVVGLEEGWIYEWQKGEAS